MRVSKKQAFENLFISCGKRGVNIFQCIKNTDSQKKAAKMFKKKGNNICVFMRNISPKKARTNLKITAQTRPEPGPNPSPTRKARPDSPTLHAEEQWQIKEAMKPGAFVPTAFKLRRGN